MKFKENARAEKPVFKHEFKTQFLHLDPDLKDSQSIQCMEGFYTNICGTYLKVGCNKLTYITSLFYVVKMLRNCHSKVEVAIALFLLRLLRRCRHLFLVQ